MKLKNEFKFGKPEKKFIEKIYKHSIGYRRILGNYADYLNKKDVSQKEKKIKFIGMILNTMDMITEGIDDEGMSLLLLQFVWNNRPIVENVWMKDLLNQRITQKDKKDKMDYIG